MTTVISTVPAGVPGGSPFAGLGIRAAARLQADPGVARPVFEQDAWDFTGVAGISAYFQPSLKWMDFTAITNPAGRQGAHHRAAGTPA